MGIGFGLTESPIGVNDVKPRYHLGSLYYHNGRYYRYVKFVDAVTYAAGHVVEWCAGFTSVTNDRTGGSSLGRCPAGVCLAAMTQNYYGFVQVAGVGDVAMLTDGSVAGGEWLVSDSGTDGGADTMAAGEEAQVFAFAIAADSGTALAGTSYVIKGLL